MQCVPSIAALLTVACSPLFAQIPLDFDGGSASGTVNPGEFRFFEVAVPADRTGWRVALASDTNDGLSPDDPDLYVRKLEDPSTNQFDQRSQAATIDTLFFTDQELEAVNYRVGVFLPSDASGPVDFHLFSENTSVLELDFDGGSASGTVNPGEFRFFEVAVPADRTGWRVALASDTNDGLSPDDPDLYVRKLEDPSTNQFDQRSQAAAIDTLFFTDQELEAVNYRVGVFLPSDASGPVNFRLFSENASVIELNWDPGTAAEGTEAVPQPSLSGGDYRFTLNTENADFGVWRTALKVIAGEADLYLGQGYPPTTTSFTQKSDRAGDDGFVRVHSSTSGANQEWHFLVVASEGAEWSLLSGDIHVEDLGELAADDSSSSTLAEVGPEGARFFRTSLPSPLPAWRLWANQGNNDDADAEIFTRRNLAPHPSSSGLYQQRFQRQDLLVPPEYEAGTGEPYFIGVYADPRTPVRLDNRRQAIADIPFNHTTAPIVADGFHFHTFRVQVPVQQIAWEVTTHQISGDPNVVARRDEVPNRRIGDQRSEVPGAVDDSFAIVPNTLTDGTFLITVYSDADHGFSLFNGEPTITDIDFTDTVANNDPDKVGWRFFRVLDDSQQLGELGWRVSLTGQSAGSQIFIRRNAVTGENNGEFFKRTSFDFLQNPDHQADIWYVGILNPEAPLGAFTLHSEPIVPPELSFDGGSTSVTSLPPQEWAFFKVTVPAGIGGESVLGWETRISGWNVGAPKLVVRRAALAAQTQTRTNSGSPWSSPGFASTFPTRYQIEGTGDWTGRSRQPDDPFNVSTGDKLVSLAMGNPLEPGTYFIGVFNQSTTETTSLTVSSRGIGPGMVLDVVDAVPGTPVDLNALAARDVAYLRYEIPSPIPAWRFELDFGAATPSGEGELWVREGWVPTSPRIANSGASSFPIDRNGNLTEQLRLDIEGSERVTVLPEDGQTTLPAGTYYAMIVSEGNAPTESYRTGTGSVDFQVSAATSIAEDVLGELAFGVPVTRERDLDPGDVIFHRFTVPVGSLALAVSLEELSGFSELMLAPIGGQKPKQFSSNGTSYGHLGGVNEINFLRESGSFTLSNPAPGDYVIAVHDRSPHQRPNQYRLTVETQGATALNFDGGMASATDLAPQRWAFFEVTVPADVNGEPVLGWESRISGWDAGDPRLVVRRDAPPQQIGTRTDTSSSSWPRSASTFPTGYQIEGTGDWTGRSWQPDDVSSIPTGDKLVSLAMGNPLEPGTYFIGVFNQSTTETTSLTVSSRGIGPGMALDVVDAVPGTPVDINALAARDVSYLRYQIPAPIPAWRFEMDFGAATPDGEGELWIREGWVPTSPRIANSGASSFPIDRNGNLTEQLRLDIEGSERVTILPEDGQTTLPAGIYFAMIASEGNAPADTHSRTGTGAVDFRVSAATSIAEDVLGELAFGVPVTRERDLDPGDVIFHRFTVPDGSLALAVSLEELSGFSELTLAPVGGQKPKQSTLGSGVSYGHLGGVNEIDFLRESGSFTLSNPAPGDYVIAVHDRSPHQRPNQYRLTVETQGATALNFDGGTASATDLAPQRWAFFEVTVPADVNGEPVLGWESRISGWDAGDPRLVVRRDAPPQQTDTRTDTSSSSWPRSSSTFPTLYQIEGRDDWTGRSRQPDDVSSIPTGDKLISLAMGNPLEPGTYFIGVFNQSATEATSLTVSSRGIGPGMALDVVDAVPDTPVDINALAARDVAYLRYQIPAPIPAWRFELDFGAATPSGEGELLIREGWVPTSPRIANSGASSFPFDRNGNLTEQLRLDIEGSERVTILPEDGQTTLPAGTYFAMIVSEGNAPADAHSRTGTGAVDFRLSAETSVPVFDLGDVGPGSSATDTATLPKGGSRFYRFRPTDPSAPLQVILRGLDATTSEVSLRTADSQLPRQSNRSEYGLLGGQTAVDWVRSDGVITVPNPGASEMALVVRPDRIEEAEFTLTVTQITPAPLGFAPGDAVANSASLDLIDDEKAFFEVEVPDLVNGRPIEGWLLELETTAGSARVSVAPGQLPIEAARSERSGTANTRLYLGQVFRASSNHSISLTSGTWFVEVEASGPTLTTLTSSPIFSEPLNSDAALNGNGLSHTAAGILGSGELDFYRLEKPASLDGEEILGWRIRLDETSGSASLRLSRGELPIHSNISSFSSSGDEFLLDASDFAPGTYFLEVRGNNAVDYSISSELITSADLKGDWTMPTAGESTTTPGLSDPLFGDSGIDASGNPLPNDLGTDIGSDETHFYALDIPEGNAGLLRARLDAISGNPNLFIRKTYLPVTRNDGEFILEDSLQSEYGNWVATDGFVEQQLPPGRYYLAVQTSGGSNARYRLRLSTGVVTDLAFDGGTANNVTLAGTDWRYFRVQVPRDLPDEWRVSYSVSQGSVDFFIRDTVPPGLWRSNRFDVVSWLDERKNQGTYNDYTQPGTFILQAPQVRPGQVYYLGFRADTDSTITVASDTAGPVRVDPPLLDFAGGAFSATLAPGETVHYRIEVPSDALRWKQFATHGGAVRLYLEQGSFPTLTSSDDWTSSGQTNSSLNRQLSSWPWQAGESFYLTAVNTGAGPETLDFQMDGRNIHTEDEDNDGLPDAWEVDQAGSRFSVGPTSDAAGDGLTALEEFFFGLPLDGGNASPPIGPLALDGSSLVFEFTRRTRIDLLDFDIEASATLAPGSWGTVAPVIEPIEIIGESTRYRATLPLDPHTLKLFLRFNIREKPAP